jgi:phosphatidate cytidylyltransferase
MKSNLIVRALTGAVFVLLLVGCMVFGPQTFAVLFAVITGMTTWEFCTIVNRNAGLQVNRFITTVAAVYFFFAVLGFNLNVMDAGIFVPYILTLLYLLISELYFDRENSIQNWAFSFMAQLYVALPFALLNTMSFVVVPSGEYGTPMVTYTCIFSLSVFIFLWSSDTGAYCFGSMLGKHRLFPRISPKKSWEGSVGGAFVAIVASQIIASFSQDFNAQSELLNRLAWGGLALVVVVFGTWGDLVESLLKRKLGIKDSGNILPGHGGMLDRFDSSLLAIPASVIYIYTLNSGSFHHFFESFLK